MRQRKASLSENSGSASAMTPESCLEVADYSPPYRPARILDLMQESVGSFADRSIAFYPLVDAIILLLGKPVALIFHRRAARLGKAEAFYLTYPEADLEQLRSDYLNDPALQDTLIAMPAPPDAEEQFFVSLARIKEVPPKVGEVRPGLEPDPYRQAANSVPADAPPTGLHGEQLDLWLLRRLFLELKITADGRSDLSLRVMQALHEGLRSRWDHSEAPTETGDSSWSDEEFAQWEDARNRIMEEQWRDILDQALPRVALRSGEAQVSRHHQALDFLCVFRFALPGTNKRFGKFRYGARIVLGRRQRAAVREWLSQSPEFRATLQGTSQEKEQLFRETFRSDPEAVLDALELPLGMNYRSISDTHFGSHFLDIAPEATYAKEGPRTRRTAGATEGDRLATDHESHDDWLRKAAERLVLDERGSRVLYVPIHVGGVPWIGLLILEDEVRGEDVSDAIWEESYHLYRGPVTTVGQQLRLSSHNAYSAALCAAVNQELSLNPRVSLDRINENWRKLAAFFPFAVPELVSVQPGEKAIEFPGRRRVRLQENTNPNASFSRPLRFDELRLPAIHHDLTIVLDTVVAKRLNALAFQESSWAHDVKNWTNPITAELLSLRAKFRDEADTGNALYRAIVYTRILNATAFARQISGERQRTEQPSHDALAEYLSYRSSRPIETLISHVLDLLLALHAENPKNQEQFELVWPSKRPSEDILTEIADFIGGDRAHGVLADPTAVLGLPIVIWPLSFLREVVHNIEINNFAPADLPNSRRIIIRYEIERVGDEVILTFRQTNFEAKPWRNKFFPGLQKANRLHGPESANVGWIDEDPELIQKDVVLTALQGDDVRVVEINYALKIRFFLRGLSDGQT